MNKRILVAGLLSGLVAFVWLFVSNAIIPVKSNMIHQVAPNQGMIHEVLKENIVEPGTYVVPYVQMMPGDTTSEYWDQPVYSVSYSGYTHGDPGSPLDLLVPIIVIFVVAFIASWLLSMTSQEMLSSYGKKVGFVMMLGVVVALFDDTLQIYMGPQPKDYLVFLAVNNIITWLLMAVVIAAKIKPREA